MLKEVPELILTYGIVLPISLFLWVAIGYIGLLWMKVTFRKTHD